MEAIPVALGTVRIPWAAVADAATEGSAVAAAATQGSVVVAAATARGVVAAGLDGTPEALLERLARRFARCDAVPDLAIAGHAPRTHLDRALAAIAAWAGGDGGALDDVPVDLLGLGEWDRLVLGGVRSIPWGMTAGYGEIARRIGRPGAARAVGGAVGRNPIALVIPCHRVIAGDGTIGGYGGGWWGEREDLIALKRRLLAHEGVTVSDPLAEAPRRR